MRISLLVICILLLMTKSFGAEAGKLPVKFNFSHNEVTITQPGSTLNVSLQSPRFVFDTAEAGKGITPLTASHIKDDIAAGKTAEITYPQILITKDSKVEVELYLKWSAKESVLRKWARFRLLSGSQILLKETVLDDLPADGWKMQGTPWMQQSCPAFGNGFFCGIEFPIASTRIENGRLLLSHVPGLRMKPGVWYETRKAVYGVASLGHEREAFSRYISINHVQPKGFHVDYNSWWTSPVPYTEKDILSLMKTFNENLYKPYKVSLDSFCIDMGWSNAHSLWEIDKKLFPDGFTRIDKAAEDMKSKLGLWISPTSFYPPALDNEWAKENGYETFTLTGANATSQRLCCLGGKAYSSAFRDRLVEMVTRYGVRHIKLDGYYLMCNDSTHGHEPGALSSEACAEGGIEAFKAVRKAAPDTWLETTCFGWSGSPWWLFYVDSVIGSYGDDAPHGRVPSPVNRESYTTARDYYNLQGASQLPGPITAQEVLGIVHQTDESFMNDAVITVMRGHKFLPLYMNPAYMNQGRWKQLAELLKWARKNSSNLDNTVALLPESWKNGKQPYFSEQGVMPYEPYGYAHWKGSSGLIVLRNPWIEQAVYKLNLDESCGTPSDLKGLSAVSIYPAIKLYGKGFASGGRVDIPLAPYETLVLSVSSKQQTAGLDDLSTTKCAIEASAKYGAAAPELTADVKLSAPQGKLLVLWVNDLPANPQCEAVINGQPTAMKVIASDAAWSATLLPAREKWVWLEAPLSSGSNSVTLKFASQSELDKASVWVWATMPGETNHYANALPSPEAISLSAAALKETSNTK